MLVLRPLIVNYLHKTSSIKDVSQSSNCGSDVIATRVKQGVPLNLHKVFCLSENGSLSLDHPLPPTPPPPPPKHLQMWKTSY